MQFVRHRYPQSEHVSRRRICRGRRYRRRDRRLRGLPVLQGPPRTGRRLRSTGERQQRARTFDHGAADPRLRHHLMYPRMRRAQREIAARPVGD